MKSSILSNFSLTIPAPRFTDRLIAGWVKPICLANSVAVNPSSLTAKKQRTLRACARR